MAFNDKETKYLKGLKASGASKKEALDKFYRNRDYINGSQNQPKEYSVADTFKKYTSAGKEALENPRSYLADQKESLVSAREKGNFIATEFIKGVPDLLATGDIFGGKIRSTISGNNTHFERALDRARNLRNKAQGIQDNLLKENNVYKDYLNTVSKGEEYDDLGLLVASSIARNIPTLLAGYGGSSLLAKSFIGKTLGSAAINHASDSAVEATTTYDESIKKGYSKEEAVDASARTLVRNITLTGLSEVAESAAVFLKPKPGSIIVSILKRSLQILGSSTLEVGEERIQNQIQDQAHNEDLNLKEIRKELGKPWSQEDSIAFYSSAATTSTLIGVTSLLSKEETDGTYFSEQSIKQFSESTIKLALEEGGIDPTSNPQARFEQLVDEDEAKATDLLNKARKDIKASVEETKALFENDEKVKSLLLQENKTREQITLELSEVLPPETAREVAENYEEIQSAVAQQPQEKIEESSDEKFQVKKYGDLDQSNETSFEFGGIKINKKAVGDYEFFEGDKSLGNLTYKPIEIGGKKYNQILKQPDSPTDIKGILGQGEAFRAAFKGKNFIDKVDKGTESEYISIGKVIKDGYAFEKGQEPKDEAPQKEGTRATGKKRITKEEAVKQAKEIPLFNLLESYNVNEIITPDGQRALGSYKAGIIKYVGNPRETTLPHETFHAFLDLAFTSKQKTDLFDLVRKRDNKKYSDLQAEEVLAEDFGEWFVANRKPKTKLQKALQYLKDFLKALFGDSEAKIKKTFKKAAGDVKLNDTELALKKAIPEMREAFQENPTQYTTKFLKALDLVDKDTVKYGFIESVFNKVKSSQGMRKGELALTEEILSRPEFKGNPKIKVEDLKNAIRNELLEVKLINAKDGYSNYGLDRIQRDDHHNETIILNSSFYHEYSGHFDSDFNKIINPNELSFSENLSTTQNKDKTYRIVDNRNGSYHHPTFNSEEEAKSYINNIKLEIKNRAGLIGHFRSFESNFLVDDKPETYYISEIQSDTFQEGGFFKKKEFFVDPNKADLKAFNYSQNETSFLIAIEEYEKSLKKKELDDAKNNLRQYLREDDGVMVYLIKNNHVSRESPYGGDPEKLFEILKDKKYTDMVKPPEESAGKTLTKEQFLSLKSSHHELIINTAIREAAEKGSEKIRFPLPETVALIEDYVVDERSDFSNEHRLSRDDVEVGKEGTDHLGDPGIVIAKDEHEYTLVQNTALGSEQVTRPLKNYLHDLKEYDREGEYKKVQDVLVKNIITDKVLKSPLGDFDYYLYEDSGETWIIEGSEGGSLEVTNETYKTGVNIDSFTIEDIDSDSHRSIAAKYGIHNGKKGEYYKYLEKTRPDLKEVTDQNGFSWWETKITPEDLKDVELFQRETEEGVSGTSSEQPRYKRTVNINDPAFIDTLNRIIKSPFSDKLFNKNTIENIKKNNFEELPYRYKNLEDIEKTIRTNVVTDKPYKKPALKTAPYKGTRSVYHGTINEVASLIESDGFKPGKDLSEDSYRGGGYGELLQGGVSFSTEFKNAKTFSDLKGDGGGRVIQVEIPSDFKIVSTKDVDSAEELNDHIPELIKQGVDAVKLDDDYGDNSENEIVVINNFDKLSLDQSVEKFQKEDQEFLDKEGFLDNTDADKIKFKKTREERSLDIARKNYNKAVEEFVYENNKWQELKIQNIIIAYNKKIDITNIANDEGVKNPIDNSPAFKSAIRKVMGNNEITQSIDLLGIKDVSELYELVKKPSEIGDAKIRENKLELLRIKKEINEGSKIKGISKKYSKLKTKQRELEVARRSFNSGKLRGVLEGKRVQRMITAEKKRLREEAKVPYEKIKRIYEKLKQATKSGTGLDVKYQKSLLEIFESFDLQKPTQKTLTKLKYLAEYIKENPDVKVDPYLLKSVERLGKTPIRDLSKSQLDELTTTITKLYENGALLYKLKIIKDKREFDKTVNNLVESSVDSDEFDNNLGISDEDNTLIDKFKDKKHEIKNGIRMYTLNPLSILDSIDGYKNYEGENAQMGQLLHVAEQETVVEFENSKDSLVADLDKLDMEESYLTKERRTRIQYHSAVSQGYMDRAEKLKESYPRFDFDTPLERQEQGVLDAFRKLFKDISLQTQSVYESLNNRPFSLSENYLPFIYRKDKEASVIKDDLDSWFNGEYKSVTVNDKHTIRREDAVGKVLSSDLMNDFMGAFRKQQYYNIMAPVVESVKRVVNDRRYRQKTGYEVNKFWKNYLNQVVTRAGQGKEGFWYKARTAIGVQTTALKASAVFIQPMVMINTKHHLLKEFGLVDGNGLFREFLKGWIPGKTNEIVDSSQFLQSRQGGSIEIAEAAAKIDSKFEKTNAFIKGARWLQRNAYVPTSFMDMKAAAPAFKLFKAGYLKQGMTEEEAANRAGLMVTRTQGSSLVSARPDVFNYEIGRISFQFQSFTFSLLNYLYHDVGKSTAVNKGALASLGAVAFYIPFIVGDLLGEEILHQLNFSLKYGEDFVFNPGEAVYANGISRVFGINNFANWDGEFTGRNVKNPLLDTFLKSIRSSKEVAAGSTDVRDYIDFMLSLSRIFGVKIPGAAELEQQIDGYIKRNN